MKKKGSLAKIVIIIVVVLALVGGSVVGIRYWMKNRGGAVEVETVASINNADWIGFGDEEGSSGTIVSDVRQSVRVPEDKVIKEVYVEEGDKVKIGDKLLAYDTTLLELDKELQELNVQEIELEIKSAEADLVKLRNTTPVERPAGYDDDREVSGGILDDSGLGDWGDDDDEDEEARLISSDREMLAAQEGEIPADAAPQAETQPAEELILEESENTQPTENNAPAGEGQTGNSTQTESADGDGEQTIENDGTIIENLTPDDLDGAGSVHGEQEFSSIDDAAQEMDGNGIEKPKMNQSLNKFLTNIRIKETDELGSERLLADTADQTESNVPVTAQINGDKVKLIPHFMEDAEHRFEKLNTYTLYIKGVRLKEETVGKSYGTDVIDGEDYPEIGGFTLVQYTKNGMDDVVKLTLAFHDGLEEQHEQGALLADMYLEIPLDVEELTGDSLIFRTSSEETEDITLNLEKPQEEMEAIEETEASEVTENTDPAEDAAVKPVSESEEEETLAAEEDSNQSESESESESESDTDAINDGGESDGSVISSFNVTVQWNHGTNDRDKWPTELTLLFYENENAPEPVYTRTIRPNEPAYNEDGGNGAEMGDAEPETEPETIAEIPAADESAATEAPLSEVITDLTDPYAVTPTWLNESVNWAELNAPRNPNEYFMSVSVENYIPVPIPNNTWNSETQSYTFALNYQEPEESPLVKLNPLSELDYASGAEGKYYKGSGTKEDPYVFFCTDGVIIRSTFVNWVLGFDELGTERLSDGYYVVLEIRESDSITGAFIKSVGLDGTIRAEHGYGPGTYWIFTSDAGIVRYEEEIPEDDFDDPGDYDDPGWEDIGETYTAEELAAAIAAKEKEIRQLKVDEKKAKLDLKKYTKELEECNVVSAINGYVQSIGESDESDAYMVVASEEGLYLKSTVSEMDLDTVEKGQIVSCTSWDTGAEFNATITQIEYFPTSTESDMYSYYGSGNANSSNYPILAVVEDADSLSEYESVSVKFPSANQAGTGKIYIDKMYIRSENGQSYVYIADENNLLKKQYVRTGGSFYGMVEVKQGLTNEDQIAFPYGKDVKEGAKTVLSSNDEYF